MRISVFSRGPVFRWGAGAFLAFAFGCGSAAPVHAPSRAAPARVTVDAAPRLSDEAWGVAHSAELGLKLALPERKAWLEPSGRARTTPAGGFGGVWELRHERSGSTLSVRRWRASRLPRLEACEAELRQRTPLPEADETTLVERSPGKVPAGFVTRFDVLVVPGKNARLRGYVLTIGAGVGECLAAVAVTESSSEAELAERLRLLRAALAHVRRTHIEDRVPRAAAPGDN